MNEELKNILYEKGADIVKFVDISLISKEETRGFDKAILFCMALSKKFVVKMYNNLKTEQDEYLEKEEQVEELAQYLAEYICQRGYSAYAQSEKNNAENGYFDTKIQSSISILPQKTIGRLSGLGFIGKNNLLITKEYGCAFSMCTVLTNAPIRTDKTILNASKCGKCSICKEVCPTKAILGNEWTLEGGRENLIDICRCTCALKCMVSCPWTLNYARGKG